MAKNYRKLVCVDFDGVIHSYPGWTGQGPEAITGSAVPGAIDWLFDLVHDDRFDVAIFSTRCAHEAAVPAMRDWLAAQEKEDFVEHLRFVSVKPMAHIYIDDRAFEFRGLFPTANYINAFRPWDKLGL